MVLAVTLPFALSKESLTVYLSSSFSVSLEPQLVKVVPMSVPKKTKLLTSSIFPFFIIYSPFYCSLYLLFTASLIINVTITRNAIEQIANIPYGDCRYKVV